MNEKELIFKLQTLKQIKPRKEWVFLVKNQILGNNIIDIKTINKPTYGNIFLNTFRSFFNKKFAYALIAFLFVIAGAFGFVKYSVLKPDNSKVNVAQQSASAFDVMAIKNSVEAFKAKSQNLAEVTKSKSQNVSLAVKEVKDAAKELASTIQKNPQLAKTVALDVNNNKAYLNIAGGDDLKETSDFLYKTIDSQMIEDLQKTTLTEDQKATLSIVKDLYDQGKYSSALENILLINSAISN